MVLYICSQEAPFVCIAQSPVNMISFRTCLVLPAILFALNAVAQCPVTVNAGDDVYRCTPPTPAQLNGDISGDYLSFNWTPSAGMIGGNTLTPTVTVSQTTSYVLRVVAADFSNNLIDNGDFENGNSGFTSDYTYNPGDLVPEGVYDVIDNPQNDHPGFSPCDDHTSGNGNMLAVNGAGSPNQNVWCQTVNVLPNTQYVFSAWVATLVASSPALLQFNINGSPLGPIFNAPGSVCNWQNFFQIWNSGSNTTATICIVNQNTALGGNDFALDDIFFNATCVQTDTVTVHVVNVNAVAAPPVVVLPCDGVEVQISGVGSSTGSQIEYEWTTPNGNIVSGENTLTPTVNAAGEYTLNVSYVVDGNVICTKTATVNVILNPNPLSAWVLPPQPLGCGAPTTLLIGNSSQPGFSTYQWTTTNGNIVGPSDQKNCTVNQVGAYSLLVTNTMTGCTATADITVIATTDVPVANAASNGLITCANDSVPLFGAGSSAGPNISYSWTTPNGLIIGPPNSLQSAAGAGGLYILHVTNTSNNCTSNDTVVVPANVTPPSVQGTLPPQLSCDPNQDTIQIFILVGPPPFVLINWTTDDGHIVSGQYTPAPQADQPGTYSVSVFDPANGCWNYDTSQVLANFTVPIADILPADTLTCVSPSIELQGSGSSVGANFSIEWTASNGGNIVSGGNSLTPVVNASGDYMLVLRDSVSLCADTAMVSVEADTNVVNAIATAFDTLTCANTDVLITSTGSSTGNNISYQWSTPDGLIFSSDTIPDVVVTAPGAYSLLVTNTANGCSATDLAQVIQDTAQPQILILPTDTLTCSVATVVIQAQNNSSAPFFYDWIDTGLPNQIISGDNTLAPTVGAPLTYVLSVVNLLNGCSATATATVVADTASPDIQIAPPGAITCAQSEQTLDATGSSSGPNFIYNWTTLNGIISAGAQTPTPAVGSAGDYILQINNTANGCSANASVSVQQNTTLPPADAGPTATLTCTQPQLTLSANPPTPNPGLMYNWTSTDGTIIGSATQASVNIGAEGTYVLLVTDPANGCTATDSVLIAANQQSPSLSIAPASELNCLTASVSLNATASGQNLSFNWQTANGNISAGQNSLNATADAPGDYTLLVTDGLNGCSSTAVISVSQDTAHPVLTVAPPATITCDAPSVTLQGQNLSLPGNFSYNWTTAGGANILSGANTLTPVIDAGGTATLLVLNTENGCETVVSVNISQNTLAPTANAGADATLSCLTNALTLNGSGNGAPNLSYLWQAGSGGNIVSGENTPAPLINQPGIYTLTVENSDNGCSATDVVQVFNDANAPMANAGTAATLTCTLIQTTLNASASTGPEFSYNWTASPGGNIVADPNTLTPVVDAPGVYTLAVTNSLNGCVATSSVTVPENIATPVVDAGATATLTCQTTSLALSGANGGGPASYVWTTVNGNIQSGANTLAPLVNQPGTYTLTATLTDNGCTASDFVTVDIDTLAPAFTMAPTTTLNCIQLSTPLSASVQQPSAGNYTVQWTSADGHFTGAQNTLSTTADAPGTYVLTLQNTQNGCTNTLSVIVAQDTAAPLAWVQPGGNLTCTQNSIALDAGGTSTGNNFSYTWSGGIILSGQGTLTPLAGSPGVYTLQVNNLQNGCSAVAVTSVGIDTVAPTVLIAQPAQLTCTQNMVTLQASGSSQGANYTALWTSSSGNIVSGQGSLTPVVNQPGTYVLQIQNSQNGCTENASVQVQQNIVPPGANIAPAPELHCNLSEIELAGSSPAGGNVQFDWASANGNILAGANSAQPSIDAPGTYTLLVTHPLNGCTSSASIIVGALDDPEFTPVLVQPNCIQPNGVATIDNVTGGWPPYTYSADGGQQFGNSTVFNQLAPGVYELVVSDANGCTQLQEIQIEPPFEPILTVTDIVKIEQGDSVQLQPQTNIPAAQVGAWEWSPATGLSCTDCPAPWAQPLYSQYYTVLVEDLNGCKAEERILVQVSRKRLLYPPTVFTPDESGENDRFTLYAKGVREIKRLAVYDRWGEEVFVRTGFLPNDPGLGWDGTFRGQALNPGVFVWAAELEYVDGTTEVVYGDVTLVR
jgi:gliding motility-associated-like protein